MYLGLDLGTTNVKAVVVDRRRPHRVGRRRAGRTLLHRRRRRRAGYRRDLASRADSRFAAPSAKSIPRRFWPSAFRARAARCRFSMRDDKPRGRVISWLDSRGQPYDASLTAELGDDFFAQRIGHGASGGAIGQILRLKTRIARVAASAPTASVSSATSSSAGFADAARTIRRRWPSPCSTIPG